MIRSVYVMVYVMNTTEEDISICVHKASLQRDRRSLSYK